MTTPVEQALDALRSSPGDLGRYRAVAQYVLAPRDVDALVTATEVYTQAVESEEHWRLWFGVVERATQLGKRAAADLLVTRAIDAVPDDREVLELIAESLRHAGTARGLAHAHRRLAGLTTLPDDTRIAHLDAALHAFAESRDRDAQLQALAELARLAPARAADAYDRARALAGDAPDARALDTLDTVAELAPARAAANAHFRWTHGRRDSATLRTRMEGTEVERHPAMLDAALREAPDLAKVVARLGRSVWERTGDAEYLRVTRAALELLGDEDGMREVLAAAADRAAAPAEQAALLYELAERRWPQEPEGAAEALMQAARSAPGTADRASGLLASWADTDAAPLDWPSLRDELARLGGDWQGAADALRERLASASGAQAASLRLELAQLLDARLGDAAGALEAIAPLAVPGAAEEVVSALADRLASPGASAEAASLLLRATDDPGHVADALYRLAGDQPHDADLRDRLVAALVRADRPDEAIAWLTRCVTDARDEESRTEVRTRLVDVLCEQDRHVDALLHAAAGDADALVARIAPASEDVERAAVRLDAHDAPAAMRLRLAAARAERYTTPEARQLATSAIRAGAASATDIDAWLAASLDDDADAREEALRLGAQTHPDAGRRLELRRALADALAARGDRAEAAAAYEALIADLPEDLELLETTWALVREDGDERTYRIARALSRKRPDDDALALHVFQLALDASDDPTAAVLASELLRRNAAPAPVVDYAVASVGAGNRVDLLVDALRDHAAGASGEERAARSERVAGLLLDAMRTLDALPLLVDAAEHGDAHASERRLRAAADAALHAADAEQLERIVALPAADEPLAVELVDRLADAGALDAAVRVARRTLARHTDSADLYDRAAIAALRLDQPDVAREVFESWAAAEVPMPNDRRVLWLTDAATLDAEYALAADALRVEPDRPEVLAWLDGQGREVHEQLARDLAAGAGDDAHVLARAATIAAECEHPKLALDTWVRALELAPTDAELVAAAEAFAGNDRPACLRLGLARLDRLEGAERTELLYRLADWTDDVEEREAYWLAVLEEELSETDARVFLAESYLDRGQHEDAAALLEEVGTLADDAAQRFDAWVALGEIRLDALGDAEGGRDAWERALRIRADAGLRERLESSYREAGDARALASIQIRKADETDNLDERVRLLRAAARQLETDAEDLEAAHRVLDRVLEIEPANLPVLEERARLEGELGRWDDHLRTLERVAEHAPVEELRTDVILRGFRVLHHHLGRHADALDLLLAASHSLRPTDDDLAALDDAVEQTGDWKTWAAVTRNVLRHDEVEDRDRLVRLAKVEHEVLDTPGDGLSRLVTSLKADPGMDERLDLAERIATDAGLRTHLVDVYRALMDAHPDDVAAVERGVNGSATIALELGRPEVAFDIEMRRLELPALRDAARERLRQLAETHDLWDRYRDVLADPDGGLATDTDGLLERARIEQDSLDDWRTALRTLVTAFRNAPFDERVVSALEDVARRADAWPVLLRELEPLCADLPDAFRLRRYLADLAETRIEDADLAVQQERHAWAATRDDDSAWAALESRALRLDRGGTLVDAVVERLEEAADADEALVWAERAVRHGVAAGSLDRTRSALDAARRYADDIEALVVAAVRAWDDASDDDESRAAGAAWARGMLLDARAPGAAWAAVAALEPDLSLRADALGSHAAATTSDADRRAWADALRAADRHADAAAALRDAAATSDDEDLWLAADDAAQAAGESATDRAAALEDVAGDLVFERRMALLEQSEDWVTLADSVVARATAAADDRPAPWLRAATVFDTYLADTAGALRAVDAGVEAGCASLELRERRAELLAALERWPEHIEQLEALAEEREGDRAAIALEQAAEAAELQLLDAARACALWRRAADAAPARTRAQIAAARMLVEAGDTDEASSLLDRALEHAPDDRARVAALMARRPLVADDEVGELMRKVLALDPDQPAARRALFDWLRERDDVEGMLELLDAEIQRVDDTTRALLLLERATLLLSAGDRAADAARSLEKARSLAPESRGVAAVEGDLHLVGGRFDDAVDAYRRALGDGERIDADATPAPIPLLPGEAASGADASVVYLARAATACERAGRTREAQEWFAAANLEDERYPVALLGLARMAVKRGAPEAAEMYLSDLRSGPFAEDDAIAAELSGFTAAD